MGLISRLLAFAFEDPRQDDYNPLPSFFLKELNSVSSVLPW